MSTGLICRNCHRRNDGTNLMEGNACPYCGSRDLARMNGDYLITSPTLKKLVLAEIIIIGILLGIIALRTDGPRISKVTVDKESRSILVTVKKAFLKNSLEYSFDNGKTYQVNPVLIVTEPGTYSVVVKDKKGKRDYWQEQVVFSDENLPDQVTGTLSSVTPSAPLQIRSVNLTNESGRGRNDGSISIHTINGRKPVRYSIDGGASFSFDSIFINLAPGRYNIMASDIDDHIDIYHDPVEVKEGLAASSGTSHYEQRPSVSLIEEKINRLFSDPENNALKDSLLRFFISQTMNVECELIGIPNNTPYQLFQFLQRRFEGQPGTKRVQIIDLGFDEMNRINRMRIREKSNL